MTDGQRKGIKALLANLNEIDLDDCEKSKLVTSVALTRLALNIWLDDKHCKNVIEEHLDK